MRENLCSTGARERLTVSCNILLLAGAFLIFCGCSANHYRKSADKQVYGIIQGAQKELFGQTNEFTIDTPYSDRKPSEITPGELIEGRLAPGEELITIDRALDMAARTSREYQAEKETLYKEALNLTGERHAFGPNLVGTIAGSYNRDSSGDQYLSVRDSKIGVSQLLKSGGSLGLSLGNNIVQYYTGNPRRSIVSTISVELTQPLLRGFGKNNPDVERLTQAERNVIYAVRNFSFFQDRFALDIVNDYFDLLAQKDVIRNRYTNYLGRVQATRRLEARSKDRERSSDVDQARQAELTAKNNYVNTVAGYRNALDQFKIRLGLTIREKVRLEDGALKELEQTGLIPAQMDPLAAYRTAVEHQLPTLNAIDKFEDSKRKIGVFADQLRPGLNFFADASLDSDRPADYTKFDPDKFSGGVGLALDLPLDRLRQRNNYRSTLISFEEQLRAFTLTLDNLQDNVQRGLRTLEQRRQNYEIQTNALALANRRVTSTTMQLEAGRAEVRDLVEAQDAQIAAQNAVTVALVDYHKARLQLMLDIGALETDQSQFWLKDHLAGYLPAAVAERVEPTTSNQAVLPPENYFNN